MHSAARECPARKTASGIYGPRREQSNEAMRAPFERGEAG